MSLEYDCQYRDPEKCNHPKVKNIPTFELDPEESCGQCLYKEPKIMKKIVAYKTVLGINDKTFSLIEGEEIEVFDTDKYGRIEAIIQGQKVLVNKTTLGRFT